MEIHFQFVKKCVFLFCLFLFQFKILFRYYHSLKIQLNRNINAFEYLKNAKNLTNY
jgi:hypothetical protein